MTAINVADVTKSYGTTHVLRGINLTVSAGEIVSVLGPNGAGKTTLIEILEGHRSRDGGTVDVLGWDPGAKAQFARLRTQIGVVLQQTMLEPGLTVRELLRRQGSYFRDALSVDAMLDALELGSHADASVRALSGGLRRRLDIALALIGRPTMLFLDEPTTGLDPLSRRRIQALVRDLRADGTTVVLTSHDLAEVQGLADTVLVLDGGVIVTKGSPQEVIRHAGQSTVVEFRIGTADGTGLPDGAVLIDHRVRYEVQDQDHLLAQLNDWSRERGIPLEDLTITRPTLEDAYAHLVSTTVGGN